MNAKHQNMVKMEKGAKQVGKFRQVMAYLWVVACVALVPEIAFANPIIDGVDWLLDLLTNGIARSAAIIGIVILGFLAWAGRITGQLVGMFILGIVLVFGGATLVDLISNAVS